MPASDSNPHEQDEPPSNRKCKAARGLEIGESFFLSLTLERLRVLPIQRVSFDTPRFVERQARVARLAERPPPVQYIVQQ
jgi:hypothetical protein